MTMLDHPTRPDVPASDVTAHGGTSAAGRSGLGRWRFAARLARREVRRRPGRTLLVMLLVAAPVLGMSVASVIAHSQADSWAERFERVAGRADLRLQVWGGQTVAEDGTVTGPPVVDDQLLGELLPAGSTWELYHRTFAPIRTATTTRQVQVTDIPLDSTLLAGAFEVRAGRAPHGSGEIALDRRTADHFGVDVGDALSLASPKGTWRVSGIVRSTDDFGAPLAVFGSFDWSTVRDDLGGEVVFVDLPSSVTPAQVGALITRFTPYAQVDARAVNPTDGFLENASSTGGRRVSGQQLAWGWVVGVLALGMLGIIIAAAFATSARRQLVTLGQLSANGANQRLLRRTLMLQGSWSGLVGALLGVAGAFVVLLLGRGTAEHVVGHDLGPYRIVGAELVGIVLTGIAAATVAALVPARGAARVPVMAALAGRRPLRTPSRRLVPIGLALFAGGLFLLMLVAVSVRDGTHHDANLYAAAAVLGGLGVVFGMCCATPLAVDALGRLAPRAPGTWKLSARALARTRSRSAGVVTAIAAAGAFAVAGSTIAASAEAPHHGGASVAALPDDTVLLRASSYVPDGPSDQAPPYEPTPVPSDAVDAVQALIGGTRSARRVALWTMPGVGRGDTSGDASTVDQSGVMVVADPFVVDLLGLSTADRSTLETVGAMSVDALENGPGNGSRGPLVTYTLPVLGAPPVTLDVATPADRLASLAGLQGELLVTPAKAAALGLRIAEDGVYVTSTHDLTDDELRRLLNLELSPDKTAFADPTAPPRVPGTPVTSVYVQLPWYPNARVPTGLIQSAIAAAAVVFTLFVVAIGLALSAVESRDERDVLMAVGARPRTMRRVAGQKALLLASCGTVLAVPTGLLPVVTVITALRRGRGEDVSLVIPWLMVGVLVVGVTVAAGAVTWLASAVAPRVRVTRMSTQDA